MAQSKIGTVAQFGAGPNRWGTVLATNLDATDFPVECFGDLYHARWEIEDLSGNLM